MSATYNKYLLSKGLNQIIELQRKKSFEKFMDVYTTNPLQKQLSEYPSFCNGLKYLPFGENSMLRIKLEPVNKTKSSETVTDENDEIIFTDDIPSLSQEKLDILLIRIAHSKTLQQKTYLIENKF